MGEGLVRCRQRMENYTKSLAHLRTTVEKESLNEIEKAGLIQFFEVAFELSWKVMKDYLITEGYDVKSPREAIKTAFDYGLISDGAKWLEALEKRNLALEIYDEIILDELEKLITNTYYPLMLLLELKLKAQCGE
ncbi:MAG: nucleotidyltransferase substrate binding protein [Sulfuricurvum sp.]|uniref:HI0074 family nucleotidyltransferase substrate-binding subunit n=1 Tax=Sulfuricurvum sp. TaxID=2025608 RepID=UPI0025E89D29|nr:HI0074 family nucleotidyltransferase substrate-binding subunit [Sulfuricurvum sp.]MCK9372780.1 nucleotidyltransferase substrate binding protein [Sulfuricurvum sp.]